MTLRNATSQDLNSIIALGKRMHAESPRFKCLAFDEGKVRNRFASMIDAEDYFVLVAEEEDGEIIGGFAGYLVEQWFSPDKLAQDLALFVKPDRRGGVLAARMVKAFASWAQERGAKQIVLGISTGVRTEETAALYKALGFKQFGYLFEV